MFESCTRNFSSLRNPHSRVPKFVFGIKEPASPPPNYSLTPAPSPNGEGSEHY